MTLYSFISRLKKLYCSIDKWLYFPVAQTSKDLLQFAGLPRAYFLCAPGRDTIGKNFILAIALDFCARLFISVESNAILFYLKNANYSL